MQSKIQKLLHLYFEKFELQSFVKQETIIKPSKVAEIFFLTKGVVRMFSLSKEGSELTLNIYKAHALFPMSLTFNKYTYDAQTAVQGYFAPKKDFESFLKSNPDVLFDLLERIYRGLDGFYMRLDALLAGNAYLRVLTQLIIYTRRFGKKNQNIITFEFHLTHHQLASQTGLARESVTKEIKKLQSKGLIGYNGKKLFVYDLSKLEKEYYPLDNPLKL